MMAKLGNLLSDIPSGRLTLTTGVPVTTSDVTAATTVYYTPYIGNKVSLYNGSVWLFHEFAELSLSLSGYTADTNYDIFIYDNSGTLTLESVAWSTATARATAIVRQDGVYVKSGDATRRYLGTIRTTSTTGQCEDSNDSRFVWNYYNRVKKVCLKHESTQHTYTTPTYRYWNNDSSEIVEYVIGVVEDTIVIGLSGVLYPTSGQIAYLRVYGDGGSWLIIDGNFNIWIVNVNANSTSNTKGTNHSFLPLLGYHDIEALEYASAATCTFDRYSMSVEILG